MAKAKRNIIAFKCSDCDSINYTTFKSNTIKDKIEKKKYCPRCQEHKLHLEINVKQ
ncbi:MAG: 50S ribosomal protein L33 [Candidatus Dojkabacteria bacterium]|jgi:large subunit ribosomal protein L33